MWALALTAAGMNVWHGATGEAGSLQVGVGYGLASLVGFAFVELLAGHTRSASAVRRRIGVVRALRFPRTAFAAWSRMAALGPGADADEAWRQAWLDRFGVEPGATGAERRAGRVAVRALHKALRKGELIATAVTADVEPEHHGAGDEHRDTGADVFEVDPPDFDLADEDEPVREHDGGERPAGPREIDVPSVDDLVRRANEAAAVGLDPALREWLRAELMHRAFDPDLSIERRVAVVEAAERADGRPVPGRRRITELLGLDSDYPVRVVLEQRRPRPAHAPDQPARRAARARARPGAGPGRTGERVMRGEQIAPAPATAPGPATTTTSSNGRGTRGGSLDEAMPVLTLAAAGATGFGIRELGPLGGLAGALAYAVLLAAVYGPAYTPARRSMTTTHETGEVGPGAAAGGAR
ncbi:hypothetical protein BJF78_36510 [Pseudonocardia sp. CNS-139]|nr:hypothetical protein BJF78_36510 [Pseudonocardia sp. CNS-139]